MRSQYDIHEDSMILAKGWIVADEPSDSTDDERFVRAYLGHEMTPFPILKTVKISSGYGRILIIGDV